MIAPAGAATVAVELGAPGETSRAMVRAEGLTPAATPGSGTAPTGPAALPPVVAPPAVPSPFLDSLRTRYPHLFDRSKQATLPAPKRRPLDRLVGTPEPVAGPPRAATVKGRGRDETVVAADGKATIRPKLRTYRPATMRVRLFEATGQEVAFGGDPLFVWSRADDSAFSPLKFKGIPDDRSMVLVKAGDFSPRENLSYEFEVKRGQKIVVEQTGEPDPSSELSVSPPAPR